jgi:membrane protein
MSVECPQSEKSTVEPHHVAVPVVEGLVAQSGLWRKRIIHAGEFLREVWTRFNEDRALIFSSSISYFMLMSGIPMLLVAFLFIPRDLILGYIGNLGLGADALSVVQRQILGVFMRRAEITTVALVIALWTGSQVFMLLEAAMNTVWHAQRRRPYWQRRGLALLMVIVVGTLLLGSITLSNLVRLLRNSDITLLVGHTVGSLLVSLLLTIVIPLLLMTTVFAIIYRVLPTKQVTVRTVIPGALVAGVLWLIYIHFFSWYTTHFTNYYIIYGSLGGFVLLLILFYYSALSLVLGAEISATYHRRLVEAGVREEQQVEEHEQVMEAMQELDSFQDRLDVARESVAYYGYRGVE